MKKILKWTGIGILALIVIGVIGAATGGNNTKTTGKTETAQNTTTNEKQEVVVEKTPEPISLTGTGQQASEKFNLKQGLSVFKMSHNGSSNFAPKLLDSNGNTIELLANEIGVFEGSKAVGIRDEGEYVLDITASGVWTITIEQPRAQSVPETKTFTGKSQEATALFSLSKGLKTFKMIHKGNSNFAPKLLDSEGNYVELLANEIGVFDGSKAVGIRNDGLYILDVTASGDWSITIQ